MRGQRKSRAATRGEYVAVSPRRTLSEEEHDQRREQREREGKGRDHRAVRVLQERDARRMAAHPVGVGAEVGQ